MKVHNATQTALGRWLWREWLQGWSMFDLGAQWGLSDREVEDVIRQWTNRYMISFREGSD